MSRLTEKETLKYYVLCQIKKKKPLTVIVEKLEYNQSLHGAQHLRLFNTEIPMTEDNINLRSDLEQGKPYDELNQLVKSRYC